MHQLPQVPLCPIPHHPPLSSTGVEWGLLSTASMHTKTNKLFLLVFSKL